MSQTYPAALIKQVSNGFKVINQVNNGLAKSPFDTNNDGSNEQVFNGDTAFADAVSALATLFGQSLPSEAITATLMASKTVVASAPAPAPSS
jgi:hypothetical protein